MMMPMFFPLFAAISSLVWIRLINDFAQYRTTCATYTCPHHGTCGGATDLTANDSPCRTACCATQNSTCPSSPACRRCTAKTATDSTTNHFTCTTTQHATNSSPRSGAYATA